MKILLEKNILETYPYLEVGTQISKDGTPIVVHKNISIQEGIYQTTKEVDVDLIIVTSDLQGIAKENNEQFLLGEKLPSFLNTLIKLEFPARKRIGVFLCGDLYTSLDKRGISGDVRKVWHEFNAHFDWVVGVAGNHDIFGSLEEQEHFKQTEGIHLLHGNTIQLDGLKIGGISGIIGKSGKTNRVEESMYLKYLKQLANKNTDFILLHETPHYPPLNEIGNEAIYDCIKGIADSRFCCGHCYWENPLADLDNNTQVLNVDSRVVLLKVVKKV